MYSTLNLCYLHSGTFSRNITASSWNSFYMLAALKPGFAQHCGLLCRNVRWNLLPRCLGLKNWVDFDTGAFRVTMWLNNIQAVSRLFFWFLMLLMHFFHILSHCFCLLIFYIHSSHCAVPGFIPTANMSCHFLSYKPTRNRRIHKVVI